MTATAPRQLFLAALHERLRVINPKRVCIPVADDHPLDTFLVRWTFMLVDETLPVPLTTLKCEISYASAGSPGATDRGKLLGTMDKELADCLLTETQSYSRDGLVIYWSAPQFALATTSGDRLERVATVEVMAYSVAGESCHQSK